MCLTIKRKIHGNGNLKHECAECHKEIQVSSKMVVVESTSVPFSRTYRYHVKCWKEASKGE